MPRKTKPEFTIPPEWRAVWRTSQRLTLCPRFRKAGIIRVVEHMNKDNCERCRAVYHQLLWEERVIGYLRASWN
jgi:hypothetical protein